MPKKAGCSLPQQARSQARVELILDTAAELFAAGGYAAATTNAIAARAGVSIGSLYQYYPDKAAILGGLVERYRRLMQAGFETLFTADMAYVPLAVQVDRVLEMVWQVQGNCPAFTYIFLGGDVAPEIATAAVQIETETLDHLQKFLQQRAPRLSAKRARLLARVTKAVLKALVALGQSASPAQRPALRAEIKCLLLAYLNEALADAGR